MFSVFPATTFGAPVATVSALPVEAVATASAAPLVIYATPAPVVEYTAPVHAVTCAVPAPDRRAIATSWASWCPRVAFLRQKCPAADFLRCREAVKSRRQLRGLHAGAQLHSAWFIPSLPLAPSRELQPPCAASSDIRCLAFVLPLQGAG